MDDLPFALAISFFALLMLGIGVLCGGVFSTAQAKDAFNDKVYTSIATKEPIIYHIDDYNTVSLTVERIE